MVRSLDWIPPAAVGSVEWGCSVPPLSFGASKPHGWVNQSLYGEGATSCRCMAPGGVVVVDVAGACNFNTRSHAVSVHVLQSRNGWGSPLGSQLLLDLLAHVQPSCDAGSWRVMDMATTFVGSCISCMLRNSDLWAVRKFV